MVEMRALITDDRYFDPVENYYNQFNYDLTASHETISIPPNMTTRFRLRSIRDLFAQIRRFGMRGEKNFIIGTHGNPNGLPIRIRARRPVTLQASIMRDICRALDGNEDARADLLNMTDLAGGAPIFEDEDRLDLLLHDIRTIRGFRLETLEFRGCSIGAGPALRALHKLLGAQITDGPRVLFAWSTMRTAHIRTINAERFARQVAGLGPSQRVFTDTDCYRAGDLAPIDNPGADTPAVAIGLNGNRIFLHARSRDMLRGFAQANLQDPILWMTGGQPAGGGYRPGRALSLIGFLTPDPQRPFLIPGDGFAYTGFIAREMKPLPINLP